MDTVLFIDDEVNILNSLKRGLIDEDYNCIFVSSAKDALDVMEKQEISVICSDMRMPGMDGLTLLRIVKEKYPKTVRVVLSGYTQLQQILAVVNQADIFKFITKPWKMEEEFKVVIRQAIDYYRLQAISEELTKTLENKNQAYQNILKRIDEVIASAKADEKRMYNTGINTVSYIGGLFDGDLPYEYVKARVKDLTGVFTNAMKLAVTDVKEFNFKDQLEQYSLRLNYKRQVSRIDLLNNAPARNVSMKPDILPLVLSLIEEHFLNDEYRYYLRLICDTRAAGSDGDGIELTVLISQSTDDKKTGFVKYKDIDEKIEMFNGPVNNILKCCSVGISCARVDSNIGIKVVFLCRLQPA